MIFALLLILGTQTTTREHVDLLETNHFHDCNGRYVYTQTIFWEWEPSVCRYHVRAWTLVAPKPQRDYRSGLYRVSYYDQDQNFSRLVTSTHYRETYSQVDPERANKRLLDERDRNALVKRLPPQPIPDDAPMDENFVEGSE